MEDVSKQSSKWPVRDVIFIATISPFMLAAFIEWVLFLAAFVYCLVKVYQKADHWSIKTLAVAMIIIFSVLRGVFLPIMITTLPLPPHIDRRFPPALVSFLQWFAFWAFAGLLTVPWLLCIYRLVTNSIGKTRRIQEVLDDRTAPKVVIIMPVYKEEPEVLIKAVNSVVNSDYPGCCIHVFLSYDGHLIDEPYLRMINHLGIPIALRNYPQSIDVSYKGARITVSRFKHGGKRHCQKQTFRLIDKVYTDYLKQHDNLFLLFIDSDCMLDRFCLQNFMYDMELKPGSKHNMLAMAGIITSTTEKNSLITVLQDLEYIHGQLFERSVESGCGAVTCLPGALTILRFSAFRKMAKYYFADKAEQCEDLFDYGKCYLGEDRWLTHLFMIGARKRYQIQMCTTAFCKTEAVQTFRSLLKQRRRWFLGYITNEVCMLTDVRLWRRYPLLCLVRLLQNTIRTTALLFFILLISILTTSSRVDDLPVGFIVISLGLNYTLMFYFGLKLKRYKAWLYPLMFILNPFFNWLYMVYGIFTAGHRTWGGPRTDAARADENTTPGQAVRQAEAQGDELNVEVETFRSGVEGKGVPVRPPEKVTGRFSNEDAGPQTLLDAIIDSEAGLTKCLSPLPEIPRIGLHTQWSAESVLSSESGWESIEMPQNVEVLVNEEKLYLSRKVQGATASRRSVDASHPIQTTEDSQSWPNDSIEGTRAKNEQAIQVPLQGTNTVAENAIELDESPHSSLTAESSYTPKSSYDSTEPLMISRSISSVDTSQPQRLSQSPKMAQSRKRGTIG
ncbi:chitin synthase-domain-containing protein [Aspergillus cavernicola]|uniref:chitin synthase n=1 Tax=Aspergillus cavernicola TaxID=176166 RepID=A0ABR4ID57_9EURO